MDFSKAFDKVDHQRLLLKLHPLGINTTVIAWIKSFLLANSLVPAQCCLVCRRDPCLGPAFFSCTLTTCQTQSKATSSCLPTTPSCTLPLEITQTVKPNNQTLPFSNPGRVYGLWSSILRSMKALGPQKKEKKTVLFDYKLQGITLQLTKNVKYLGIQISDDLAWSKHINQMTTKSNNTLKLSK